MLKSHFEPFTHFGRELANVAKYAFFLQGEIFFWKHEVSHKEGIPNLGKLLVELLFRKKFRYTLKVKIYCFQVLEMRKVPTQSIEKRGRETRETSRQDFFQRPQRQREGERKAGNVKDPEKEKMKWEQGGEESVMEEEKVRRF